MKIYIAGNFPPKGSKHRELIKWLQKEKCLFCPDGKVTFCHNLKSTIANSSKSI